MQALTPIWMTLSLDLDTYRKWEQLARVAPCKSIVDIENLQNTYGSKCGRPVDYISLTNKT